MYYLNSRYYDSRTGRFINPDSISYLGSNCDLISYNLYTYCSNNPVMYTDPSGHFVTAALIGSIIAGIVIGIGAKYVPDVAEKISEDGFQLEDLTEPWKDNWKEYTIAGLTGGVIGASFGVGLGFGAAAYQIGTVISAGTAITAFAGTTIGSFAAGIGIYTLETSVFGLESYNQSEMWQSGFKLGIKGAANYGMGLLIGNQGFYSDYSGIKGTLIRTYLKAPILTPFNMFLDEIFEVL